MLTPCDVQETRTRVRTRSMAARPIVIALVAAVPPKSAAAMFPWDKPPTCFRRQDSLPGLPGRHRMKPAKPVVLITGGAGRIGSALANAYTVVSLELHCKGLPDCIEADVTDEVSLARAIKTLRTQHGGHIASVIYLAAYFDFTEEANPKYEQVNVRGTARLLRALQALQGEQFVYAKHDAGSCTAPSRRENQ